MSNAGGEETKLLRVRLESNQPIKQKQSKVLGLRKNDLGQRFRLGLTRRTEKQDANGETRDPRPERRNRHRQEVKGEQPRAREAGAGKREAH